MALNFPSPATNGQTWTDPTGRQWVYDTGNNSWTAKGGASGGMVYKGGIDVTTAPPAGVQSGWLYVVTTSGTLNAGFTGLTGTIPVGSQIVFGGPNWQVLSSPGPWGRAGTELAPANAGDSVFTSGAVKVGGTTAAPNITVKADGGIVANTNGLVYDATTKRLGIGVTSPGAALTLGDTSAESGIQLGDGADFTIKRNAASLGVRFNSGGDLNNYQFQVGGAEALRIDSSGKLLVGTSSSTTGASSQYSKFQVIGNNSSATDRGAYINLGHSAGAASITTGELLGSILFTDNADGEYAQIACLADGTAGSGDHPGRLVFSTTADGASSPTERMRITQSGGFQVLGVYSSTTGSAANVIVDSSGTLQRSTSSIKYKTDVEPIEDQYADSLLQCRPVWYRSTCTADNPSYSYWGFIAEEVAAIDPRLVHWKTTEAVVQENGSLEHVPCDPEPEGVQYDRFVPHLLNLIKRQKVQIEAMEARLSALEAS